MYPQWKNKIPILIGSTQIINQDNYLPSIDQKKFRPQYSQLQMSKVPLHGMRVEHGNRKKYYCPRYKPALVSCWNRFWKINKNNSKEYKLAKSSWREMLIRYSKKTNGTWYISWRAAYNLRNSKTRRKLS